MRRTALPAPGGEDELRTLVGRVMSQNLDRAKPLWEMWVVEGLDEGRWALISKVHHAMVDGVATTDLMTVLLDKERNPERPPPESWSAEPAPGGARLLADAIVERAVNPFIAAEQLVDALRASAAIGVGARRHIPRTRRGSPAWRGVARPPRSTARSARTAAGTGPAAACRTCGSYARRSGAPSTTSCWLPSPTASASCSSHAESRSTACCVRSFRSRSGVPDERGTYNNRVSAMFAELPVGIEDPVARLESISAQMAGLKESKQAVAGETLTSLSGFAPPMLLALGARLASRLPQHALNTGTTNVPGPQFPLYLAGRRMLESFPYIPLFASVRVAVAIFSYDGALSFGVSGDYDTAPDIDVLCRGIERGLSQLVRLAQPPAERPEADAQPESERGEPRKPKPAQA